MERPVPFRDPELDTSGDIVGFYPREFYTLDNFAAFQVDYMERRWPTSEHAYHAAKFRDIAPHIFDAILYSRSPHDALKLARMHRDIRRPNWDEVKIGVMYDICKLKALQNPYVLEKLLATGDLDIVEDSPKDAFWGWGPNRDGRNELGKIWMKLREQFRNGEISAD